MSAPGATGAECIVYAQRALKRCRKIARAVANQPAHKRRQEGRRAQRVVYALLQAAEWATRANRTGPEANWLDTCSVAEVTAGAKRLTFDRPLAVAIAEVETAITTAAAKQAAISGAHGGAPPPARRESDTHERGGAR